MSDSNTTEQIISKADPATEEHKSYTSNSGVTTYVLHSREEVNRMFDQTNIMKGQKTTQ
jgi:hypothetical protein